MLLKARLHPVGDDSHTVLERLLPVKSLRAASKRYPVEVGDPILSTILQEGDSASGFWVSAEAVFTEMELRSISHFEAVCRKFISESPADYDHNEKRYKRTKLIPAGGEAAIRLPYGFALTRIGLKPNMVGAIGQWTEEYVIGSAVVDVFKKAEFTGWSTKPVLNLKKESPHTDFVQIYSDVILGAGLVDCSVERIKSDYPEENGQLRHLGCLSYPAAALQNKPDFARTAEPWGGWRGQPSWIVKSRVAGAFAENKLRGWAFRPVLVAESDLYRNYLNYWKDLREAVAKSSFSEFDGGRW